MTAFARRYRVGLLALLLGLSALTSYLWPLGFSAFPALTGIALLPLFRPRDPNPVFIALLALAFVMICSLSWSGWYSGPLAANLEPDDQTWAKLLLQLAIYAALLSAAATALGPQSHRLKMLFVSTTGLLAVLVLIDALMGAALYQRFTGLVGTAVTPDIAQRNLARATYALALMAWPAWAILWDRGQRPLAFVIVAATLASAWLLSSMAPILATVAGGVVYLVSRHRPERMASVFGVLAAVVVVAAPWAVLAAQPHFDALAPHIGASLSARLDLWTTAAQVAMSHPLLGWGLDSSRIVYGDTVHPHAAPLQIWLEFGVLGAVLFALFWLLTFREAGKAGAHAVAAATVYFVIGALSFSVWKEWWIGLGAMACVWSLLARRDEEDDVWDIEA